MSETINGHDNIVVVKDKRFNLKLCIQLHSDLCDIIELINKTFTTQIVFVMTGLLVTNVFFAYSALNEYIYRLYSSSLLVTLTNIACITIQYSIKALVAHAGSSTTRESEKTLVLVTKVLAFTKSGDDVACEPKMILLAQMQYRKKNLENIFFNINWNLILTVSF